MMKNEVTSWTTSRVLAGAQQAVSLHRRNEAKDEIGMIEICMMSFAVDMHTTVGIRGLLDPKHGGKCEGGSTHAR
jgi:hypothetical protein